MLEAGTKLGPYEITGAIGAGGMGEVYRARDTKLGRDVALKVLLEAFAADPERMARFEREAKVLASLNHPNIATIHGLEESNGLRALVMELVEGPTLADRIATGPTSLEEVLPIARQICEGLEYAHERGIIHRDLKPANIKITPDGAVKILDFGLAKALEGDAATSDPSTSPTLSHLATQAGVILGTAAYMSPEQAKGKAVDRRADIWAFGCVLYEILTGKPAFGGETVSDVLAAVIRAEPDWSLLSADTPPRIRELLQRCLKKDPRLRLQSIGDARIAIQEAQSDSGSASYGALRDANVTPALLHQTRWAWMAAAVAMVTAIGAGIGWWRSTRPAGHPLARFDTELTAQPNGSFRVDETTFLQKKEPGSVLALSPDGKRLIIEIRDTDGKSRLAIRKLDEREFKPLPGTEDPASPFFSPDGQWIAFFGDGKLRKIPVNGGAAVTLCQAGIFAWGSWGDDGNIIFSALLGAEGGLQRIPSAGGKPTPVAGSKARDLEPQVLPGSEAVLFTAWRGSSPDIEVLSFKTHERKTLVQGAIVGRFVAASRGAGYLIYVHQNTLFAAPFDLGKLAVTGTARPVLDDVNMISPSSPAEFDISRTGTLVYISGKGQPKRELFWLDPTGRTQPLRPEPGFYSGLHFSPNGKRLAFAMGNGSSLGRGLWIQDLERNTSVRLTSSGGDSHPLWSPDGTHILFANGSSIYWVRSDGIGEPQKLAKLPELGTAASFSPDGKWLAFEHGNPFTTVEVSIAPFVGTADRPRIGKPKPFLQASGFMMPAFSPDERWIAYSSAETGTTEIYVQRFPGPAGKVVVSTGGGSFPVWSRRTRELFYLGPDYRIRVVDYAESGDSFSPGTPRVWSPQPILLRYGGGPFQPYALAPDGKRFAVMLYPDGTAKHQGALYLTFLLNFADELNRRLSPR